MEITHSQEQSLSVDPTIGAIHKLILTMGEQPTTAYHEARGWELVRLGNIIPDDTQPQGAAVREVLADAIRQQAAGMVSADATDRAEARRFFDKLQDTAYRAHPDAPEQPEKTPDEKFMTQAMSGQEMRSCMVAVLASIEGQVANMVRDNYEIPPGRMRAAGDARRLNVFEPHEHDVAAAVIGVNIGVSDSLIGLNEIASLDALLEGTRQQIVEMLSAKNGLFGNDPEQIQAEVDSVCAKLPRLLRKAFEGHRASLHQMRSEARGL
jgi:hypothetical protein